MSETPTLTKADFQSDQETRWCPGCGDYAVLAAVQSFFPELGIPPENIVFEQAPHPLSQLHALIGRVQEAKTTILGTRELIQALDRPPACSRSRERAGGRDRAVRRRLSFPETRGA